MEEAHRRTYTSDWSFLGAGWIDGCELATSVSTPPARDHETAADQVRYLAPMRMRRQGMAILTYAYLGTLLNGLTKHAVGWIYNCKGSWGSEPCAARMHSATLCSAAQLHTRMRICSLSVYLPLCTSVRLSMHMTVTTHGVSWQPTRVPEPCVLAAPHQTRLIQPCQTLPSQNWHALL